MLHPLQITRVGKYSLSEAVRSHVWQEKKKVEDINDALATEKELN